MGKRTKTTERARGPEAFTSPIARVSQDAMERIERARHEAPPQVLVDAFRRNTRPTKTLTPREIREYADRTTWRWSSTTPVQDDVVNNIASALRLQASTVRRALSRRDKRTPKSEGGPVTEGVTIRLNAAQKKKALKLAKKAGYKTVPGWVKALVEREVGK